MGITLNITQEFGIGAPHEIAKTLFCVLMMPDVQLWYLLVVKMNRSDLLTIFLQKSMKGASWPSAAFGENALGEKLASCTEQNSRPWSNKNQVDLIKT